MNVLFKKLLVGIVLSLQVVSAAQAFEVVFDPQAVKQAIMIYQAQKQQYEAAKRQYEAMTGTYNVTEGIKKVLNTLPETWGGMSTSQGGEYGAKQKAYGQLLQIINPTEFGKLMEEDKLFKQNYGSVVSGMAVSDSSYNQLQTHINNLNTYSERLNNTLNVKEAMDLANAIAVTQAQISAITGQLNSVQTNIAANQSTGMVSDAQMMDAWNR